MSYNSQDGYGQVYHAQARIITDLKTQISNLQIRNSQLEQQYANAIFYRAMSDAIAKHEVLSSEWVAFVSMLRLCEPTLEQEIKSEIDKHTSSITRQIF